MPTTNSPTNPRRSDYRLQVNAYDRTATLLLALLVMVGLTVAGLAVVFFADKFNSDAREIMVVPIESSSPNANMGAANEPEPPGVDDAPELSEPQLETTLDTLSAAVSLDTAITSDVLQSAGQGNSQGDSRQLGTGGDGVVERVPRFERWKFRFEPDSPAAFKEWLDEFDLRIGVIGKEKIHTAYDFRKNGQVESLTVQEFGGQGFNYTFPTDGPMPGIVKLLASQAGIGGRGRYSVICWPRKTEDLLWTIEYKYRSAKGVEDVNRVRETVFTVLKKSGRYEFEVVDMKFF